MRIGPYGATVLVDGHQLTGAVDREAEARLQAPAVPEDAPVAWLYGCGLGDLCRVLLDRPALQVLNVAVLSAELFARLRPLPDDPRIRVHLPGTVRTVYVPGVVCPGDLRYADPEAYPLRDALLATINAPYNEWIFGLCRQKWDPQRAANEPLTAADPRVSALADSDTRDAIVVAGGPTASDHLEWIAARAKSHHVIACSRALLPLLAAGIVPQTVVIIDRQAGNAAMFPEADERLRNARLVYIEDAFPAIPAGWCGPRAWLKEGDLYCGGSVVHAAADLATLQGACTVHLVGADFCFPGGRSHLDGTAPIGEYPTTAPTLFSTIDGNGRQVATQESMMQYHRSLEMLIAQRPGARWIKHDRRGVPLQGAEWADEQVAIAA